MFCYRVRKYIGAYMAVLGGAEAIIFGGGIGENTPVIRENLQRFWLVRRGIRPETK
jgi:acetate kinase